MVGVNPDLAAVLLVVAAISFFVLEAHIPGVGVPAVIGVVCLAAAGLLLFGGDGPVRVPIWGIAAIVAVKAAVLAVVVRGAIRARRLPHALGRSVLGAEGVCVTALDPTGSVRVRSEEWSAESAEGPIPAGERVVVMEQEGLRLRVARF